MRPTRSLNLLMTAAILIASQFACNALSGPTQPTPLPSTTVPPTQPLSADTPPAEPAATEAEFDLSQFSDEDIQAGIQTALDQFAEAYTYNEPDLLEYVVDQTNKPFRRIVRSRFDDYQKSSSGGQLQFQYRLIGIERREFGYIIGHFETLGGFQADWPFRYYEDHWVLTEPTVEQVGEAVKIETEHFNFTVYPWADDVNGQIMDMLETARSNVESVLGKVPDEKANVIILPIYGLRPGNSSGAIASYDSGQGTLRNVIQIYAPHSYAYSFYDPALGWDGELLTTIVHEYTHMTHNLSFSKAGALSDWMSEGIAEYVAGQTDNKYWACQAVQSGTFIPILDESDAVYKQDLMHMYLLEQDFSLSYDFATSLVDYTVEKHGGLDGFWKLATALDETSDFKKAVQSAFGITYEQYNTDWQIWLKNQC